MEPITTYQELRQALESLGYGTLQIDLTPSLATAILEHDPVNRDLRRSNVDKLKREITGGFWDVRKSPPLRFLPDLRLADGQHRCVAVTETETAIRVNMTIIPDTIGLDQGATRSLPDQLRIHAGISEKDERTLAATVTKSICDTRGPNDRELIEFFDAHKAFILECVHKPLLWLADKEPSVAAVMKPGLLAVTRAQEIFIHHEPAEEVDEFLNDVVNGGATAPIGSARRELARQVWDQMQVAHTKRGAKVKDVIKWTRNALEYKRRGVVRNAITARFPSESKRRRPATKAA